MENSISSLFGLDGKTAIVAGGAGDIGAAIAQALAGAGAGIVLVDRDPDRLERQVGTFESMGLRRPITILAELSNIQEIRRVGKDVENLAGDASILVNAHGVNRRKLINDIEPDDFDFVTSVNFRSVFFLSQTLRPQLARRGGGKVLHIGSVSANLSFGTIAVYAATKAAIASLTRSMSHEWASDNIQVNTIEPGFVQTELTRPLWGAAHREKWFKDVTPLGRMAQVNDIVGAALYLVSPAADYVTGRTLAIEGGILSGMAWPADQ